MTLQFSTSVELLLVLLVGWLVSWARVTENGSKDFLDFLHNDSKGKLKNSYRARFSKKNVGAPGDPILGVKNDPFFSCSSLSPRILLKMCPKDRSDKDLSNHVDHPYLKHVLDP